MFDPHTDRETLPARAPQRRDVSHVGARRVGRAARGLALVLVALALGACGTLTSSGRVPTEAGASWAVLPIENLSSTPLAGRTTASLVETRLRARGVTRVARIEPAGRAELVALLDDAVDRDAALRRARADAHRYALEGTVHEWRYRGAPDGEPVVGLSLRLLDVADGRVLWQGSAARGGWGGSTLSALGDRVVAELLAEIELEDDGAFAPR